MPVFEFDLGDHDEQAWQFSEGVLCRFISY